MSVLEFSAPSLLSVFPFYGSSAVTFLYYSFWLELACELLKSLIETRTQGRKEIGVEVINKIKHGPCVD